MHSHGPFQGIFSFFSGIMTWMKYRCIAFKQEIGNFHFFIFFYHLCLFFQNFPFLPILRTPMGHPSSPMTPICSFMSPGPNQSMNDITNGYYWWILEFFSETSIFPFLAILTPGDPLYGQALTEGGFGEHFYGPQAVPWTQPQSRKNSQFNQKPNSCSVISTT